MKSIYPNCPPFLVSRVHVAIAVCRAHGSTYLALYEMANEQVMGAKAWSQAAPAF